MIKSAIQVDTTLVNNDEEFIYHYHLANSSPDLTPQAVVMVNFFPDNVEFSIPKNPPVKNSTVKNVPGGKELTIDFGIVDNIAFSTHVSVYCNFTPDAKNNDFFTNNLKVYVNDVLTYDLIADTVTLVKTEPPEKRSIGGFVWVDSDKNGLYEQGEEKMNGMNVVLYTGSRQLVATTTTANSPDGEAGHYIFDNLENDAYYLKFIPLEGYSLTQRNALEPNGSVPFPDTGKTNLYSMGIPTEFTNELAGIILNIPPTINATDQFIYVGDTFDPMAGVTATDFDGNDITGSIAIDSNNVDTTTPGEYHVTYSVTDSKNEKTILTITVFVVEEEDSPRTQAITDIIESVALEKTALAHILNTEGKKIQKAIAMDLSTSELAEINNSVTDMVNSISALEEVLQGKVALFEKCICK